MNNAASQSVAPMRICMVSDDFAPGRTGVGSHLQSVVKNLVTRHHDVSILTTRRRGEAKVENWHGATVYRSFSIPIHGYYQSLASKREIRAVFAAHDPNIVHCHYLSNLMISAVSVAQAQNLKSILTYHMPIELITSVPLMRPMKSIIDRIWEKSVNRFDTVISPSRGFVDELKAQGVRVPIEYLSNPIRPPELNAPHIRRDPEAFIVLFAGRLAPEKNIGLLVDAFVQIEASLPNARLWIAGDGELRASLEQRVGALGVAGKTRFLGPLSYADLAGHYVASDVFVLPSKMETQGLVIMEAMSYSNPVIATTEIVSGPELIEQGINGYLVDPDDPKDLAEKLIALANDSALRSSMGEAGFERTAEFTEDTVIGRLERIYQGVLSERVG
ncbi:MAG: 1,2-diacylglycerol 3-alpha-glucosyltransferase [Gammaproteobacteria bacterium]|jgi:1,2-diacylglycerol 3-alpha-glucosyltransferase